MNEKSAEYYQAAEQSVHVFFLWLLEKVTEEMKKRKLTFSYCSFLTNMLEDLDVIAKECKAKEVKIFKNIVPLSGITFTHNDSFPTQGCNDALYRFDALSSKPCYLGTLTMINSNPQIGVTQNAISFILADNEDDGLLAMTNYYQTRRELCKARCEVTSFVGEKIENFQKRVWEDLCLPKKTLDDMRLEVKDFFKAEQYYDAHGIRYRRGMALVGARGNGKTTACQVIASTIGVPVVYGSAAQLTMEGIPQLLERTMGYNTPCVVVIEDLDMVIPGDDPEPLIALLSVLENVSMTEGIFLIGTINSDSVDASVFRPGLFDVFYFFSNPSQNERNSMFCRVLGKFWTSMKAEDRKSIVEKLEGCSGAVIQEVMSRAILESKGQTKLPNLIRAIEEIMAATNHGPGSSIGF